MGLEQTIRVGTRKADFTIGTVSGDKVSVPGVSLGAKSVAFLPERPDARRRPPILSESKAALYPDVGESRLREEDSEEQQFSHPQGHEHVESVSRKLTPHDVREIIYGVDGALTRLERLSVTIRQASKGGLSRKVETYAKKHDNGEFDRRIGIILSWLFKELDSGLAEQLRKSIVYRCYRLLYQRRHQQRVQSNRQSQSASATNPIETKSTTNPSPADSGKPQPSKRPPQLEPKDSRRSGPESVVDSKSGRSTLEEGFDLRTSQSSPPASEVSGSSAAWTGEIDYPAAPRANPEVVYTQCPICYERYDATKFLGQRAWR